jgi:hypothetical protein
MARLTQAAGEMNSGDYPVVRSGQTFAASTFRRFKLI